MLLTARLAKALQLTLAVIKPDGVAHPLVLEVGVDFCAHCMIDAQINIRFAFILSFQSRQVALCSYIQLIILQVRRLGHSKAVSVVLFWIWHKKKPSS